MRIIIELTDSALELISRPVKGSGGWQSLLRKLQQNVSGNELTLSTEDIVRIIRYSLNYGQGGYEDRLRPVVDEIVLLVNAILDPLGHEPIQL